MVGHWAVLLYQEHDQCLVSRLSMKRLWQIVSSGIEVFCWSDKPWYWRRMFRLHRSNLTTLLSDYSEGSVPGWRVTEKKRSGCNKFSCRLAQTNWSRTSWPKRLIYLSNLFRSRSLFLCTSGLWYLNITWSIRLDPLRSNTFPLERIRTRDRIQMRTDQDPWAELLVKACELQLAMKQPA